MNVPETCYARSGGVNIAYQTAGDGPFDLVFVPPFISNVELGWEMPGFGDGLRGLAAFARLIIFDKRGTGLSDRAAGVPALETRMDDVRAVMDAAGSERAVILGVSEGGPMSILFSATYPERTRALILASTYPKFVRTDDYPWGPNRPELEDRLATMEREWGTKEFAREAADYLGLPGDFDMARFQRHSASPGAAVALVRMNAEIDVRAVLPAIRVPTLLLFNRANERDAAGARYMAERLRDARSAELSSASHGLFTAGEVETALALIRRFAEQATARPDVTEPHRVLATVLFTDIVDSTSKAVELGDSRWRDLRADHHARVRSQLARFGGREIDTAGDGFFASFDGPARAVRCACEIRNSVIELGLEVRAGLHTGECEDMDGKVGGVAVITGARVAAAAAPNEVLVSATVRDLVAGSGLEFEDRGLHVLKGLPEERRLYAAVGA